MQEIIEEVVRIPNQYLCPISTQLMVDPVIAGDGISYEREFIQTWFGRSANSPFTGARLPHKSLIPNIRLRQAIQTFKNSLPSIMQEKQIAIDLQFAIQAKQSQMNNYINKREQVEKFYAVELAETKKELHKKNTQLEEAKKTIQWLNQLIQQIDSEKQAIQKENVSLISKLQIENNKQQEQKKLNPERCSSKNKILSIKDKSEKDESLQILQYRHFSETIQEHVLVELGLKYFVMINYKQQSQIAQYRLKKGFLIAFSLIKVNQKNKILIYYMTKQLEQKLIIKTSIANPPGSLLAYCKMVEKYFNKKAQQSPLQYETYIRDNVINRKKEFQIPQDWVDISR